MSAPLCTFLYLLTLLNLTSSLLRAPLGQARHVHHNWPPCSLCERGMGNDVVPDMPFAYVCSMFQRSSSESNVVQCAFCQSVMRLHVTPAVAAKFRVVRSCDLTLAHCYPEHLVLSPGGAESGEAALLGLLASRATGGCAMTSDFSTPGARTVFQSSRVARPQDASEAANLVSLLSSSARSYLDTYEQRMLHPVSEVAGNLAATCQTVR